MTTAFVHGFWLREACLWCRHPTTHEPPSPRGLWLFQTLHLASALTSSSAARLGTHRSTSLTVIRAAFAIRDSLGWDRALPPFTAVLFHHAVLSDSVEPDGCSCPVLPRRLQPSSLSNGLGTPVIPPVRSGSSCLRRPWWGAITELNRFTCITAWWIARLLDGPTWDASRPPRLLHLSFRPAGRPCRTSGITTAPTGQSAPMGLSPTRTATYWAALLSLPKNLRKFGLAGERRARMAVFGPIHAQPVPRGNLTSSVTGN